SRRRHTRSLRDWSSDVCSSDLYLVPGFFAGTFVGCGFVVVGVVVVAGGGGGGGAGAAIGVGAGAEIAAALTSTVAATLAPDLSRSEERRVGKEGRSGWAAAQKR